MLDVMAIQSMWIQGRSDASRKQTPHMINSTLWSAKSFLTNIWNPTHASIDLEGLRIDILIFL